MSFHACGLTPASAALDPNISHEVIVFLLLVFLGGTSIIWTTFVQTPKLHVGSAMILVLVTLATGSVAWATGVGVVCRVEVQLDAWLWRAGARSWRGRSVLLRSAFLKLA